MPGNHPGGDGARPTQHLPLCLSLPAHPQTLELTEPLIHYVQKFWAALFPVPLWDETSYHPLTFEHTTAEELSYLCFTFPASFFHNHLIHGFGFRQQQHTTEKPHTNN